MSGPTASGTSEYNCQDLVDELYAFCAGQKGFLFFVPAEKPKRMPDGFFYDPDDTIAGKWTAEVQQAVKIAVEKCGCDAAAGRSVLGAAVVGLLALLFV